MSLNSPAASPQPSSDTARAAQCFLLMATAMIVLPGMDATAKYLSTSISPLQVTWGRFFFQTVVLLPIIIVIEGWRGLWPNRLAGNVARGALIAIASLMYFTAVKFMPLADAMAIFFVEPMILTLLSALILKEEVGWRRRIAVVVGFIGAMIVIRPSFADVGPVALLPLAAATLFSFYLILTRRLVTSDSGLTMQFVAGVTGAVILSAVLAGTVVLDLPDLRPSAGTPKVWALLFTIGFIAALGHLMVVQAFQRLPVSVLAGFQYIEIVTATLLGLWLFGDFPDMTTWVGIAVIVGSGLYIYWRERRTDSGMDDPE